MKKHFVTGLATLLPLLLTTIIVLWVVGFLTKPFMGLVEPLLQHFDLDKPIGFLNAREVLLYTSRFLVLIFLFVVTLLIGLLIEWYVLHRMIALGDWIIHRIPFVGKVYKSSQEVITRVLNKEATNFKKVVLVPFPHQNSKALAFITNDAAIKEGTATVFLPGAPNPLMGFLLSFPQTQVIETDIAVDEALRFMVSCGALAPDSTTIIRPT